MFIPLEQAAASSRRRAASLLILAVELQVLVNYSSPLFLQQDIQLSAHTSLHDLSDVFHTGARELNKAVTVAWGRGNNARLLRVQCV